MAQGPRPVIIPSWAFAALYPAGILDWSGQPTRVQPSAGKIAIGFTPLTNIPFEELNFLIGLNSDWASYLSPLIVDAPQIAVAGSGFTAPSYTAFGGTVTPSGSVKIATGSRFVIQIQSGGAVGAATFKTSTDGGATFGALQTTAASMADATSGITLAFTGTLTTSGTASFRSAFTPQSQWQDAAGNIRSLVDHNGYRAGRVFEFNEGWVTDPTAISATVAPIAKLPRWSALIASGGTITPSTGGMTSTYPAPAIGVATSATNGSKASLYSANGLARIGTIASVVCEFDIGLNATGTYTAWAGLDGGNDPQAGSTHAIRIRAQSGTANWQVDFIETGTTTIDSGVVVNPAAVDASSLAVRIEVHGASSPLGKIALVFINGVLVATSTNVPLSTNLQAVFEMFAGAVTSASQLIIGTFTLTVNRSLSPSPI